MKQEFFLSSLKNFPKLPAIDGLRIASCNADIRYKNRPDLMLAEFAPTTIVGGVMTKSQVIGAPIKWNRKILNRGKARALVVNSGIANVFTGNAGDIAVHNTALKVAEELCCDIDDVYIASTGTIGDYLDETKITSKINMLKNELKEDAWIDAAKSILTTDTFPKGAHQSCKIDNAEIQIGAIAKGSGMIAPDMATMLAFVITDANLSKEVIQYLIKDSNEKSFNCITVDSDTSTSDTLLMFATCKAKHKKITDPKDPKIKKFIVALDKVLSDLAKQIVIDGEGAKKFIQVSVSGAKSFISARKIGLSIANSPLVKTAIAGEDANWGRIVMAIGKSGEPINSKKIDVTLGGIQLAANGQRVKKINEDELSNHLAGGFIDISVNVGAEEGKAQVWTCDLTHDYVTINADYRT